MPEIRTGFDRICRAEEGPTFPCQPPRLSTTARGIGFAIPLPRYPADQSSRVKVVIDSPVRRQPGTQGHSLVLTGVFVPVFPGCQRIKRLVTLGLFPAVTIAISHYCLPILRLCSRLQILNSCWVSIDSLCSVLQFVPALPRLAAVASDLALSPPYCS